MPQSIITGQSIPGKSGVTLMARLRGQDFTLITQASLTSIAWTLTDRTTGLAVANAPFTVATVIFDTLQQGDGSWSKDSKSATGPDGTWGYNFRAILPAANIVPAGDRFQCDVVFTPVTGEPFRVVFQFQTLRVFA